MDTQYNFSLTWTVNKPNKNPPSFFFFRGSGYTVGDPLKIQLLLSKLQHTLVMVVERNEILSRVELREMTGVE